LSREPTVELPRPETFSASDKNAMAALKLLIQKKIEAAGGAISFAQYMELALYAPRLGYYVRDDHGIGAQGDFVTAPELSSVFGHCIANQCLEVLMHTGGGIAEIGAGTGKLALDLLTALPQARWPEHYTIVEKSPALRVRQRATLAALPVALGERVRWADSVPRMNGIIVANEVLDALAVERFKIRAGEIWELQVGCANGSFEWLERPATDALSAWWEDLSRVLEHSLADGYMSERCAQLPEFLRETTAPLRRGVALFLDYGYPRHEYFHPQRMDGTLLCHLQQRAHDDPFWAPGLQDITASVDFTAVAECAGSMGLEVAGYTTQAWFLLATGIDAALAGAAQADERAALHDLQAAKRLLLPGEMGERIQAIALTKDYSHPLLGMQMRDTSARLGARDFRSPAAPHL
jgi:SAM-dependent MidA family methyltransferase